VKIGEMKKKIDQFLYVLYHNNLKLSLGFTLLLFFIVIGFIIPSFAPSDPVKWNSVPRDLPPSREYILGTTSLGQSVLWFLSKAIGNSLLIGSIVASFGTIVGVSIGLLAGFYGSLLDKILVLFIDTFIAVPSLPILILFASFFKGKASILVLSGILSIFNWSWPARQVRSMVLSIRERNFIDTAYFSGEKTGWIIFGEILPHIFPWAAANFTNTVLVAIGMETGLAVVGLSNLEQATLGTMLFWSLNYQAMLRGLWWWITPCVIAIILLFISLFLISTGLSEYLSSRRSL